MPIINDNEFGRVVVRRSPRATQVRLRVAPDGTLRASLPLYAPLFLVKHLIKSSRHQLRELQLHAQYHDAYYHGMVIGKSHMLIVTNGSHLRVAIDGQQIIVELPDTQTLSDTDVHTRIREVVIEALRIEARSYLPKRLAYLAEQLGCEYERVRFSHASGRWGSCSSKGTISLNIALMKLPFELIDYVLVHELTHTKHMDHSTSFWAQVAKGDPQYRAHRRALKDETPSI